MNREQLKERREDICRRLDEIENARAYNTESLYEELQEINFALAEYNVDAEEYIV